MSSTVKDDHPDTPDEGRREFLYLAAAAVGGVGAAITAWPLIDSLNPSADVTALSSIDVDLAPITVGQRVTVKWRGNPVFIDHRTPKEITEANSVNVADLRAPLV